VIEAPLLVVENIKVEEMRGEILRRIGRIPPSNRTAPIVMLVGVIERTDDRIPIVEAPICLIAAGLHAYQHTCLHYNRNGNGAQTARHVVELRWAWVVGIQLTNSIERVK
jgi:hypothetical protein